MSDYQFLEDMESLQIAGRAIKFYAHKKNHFSHRHGFFSRAICEAYAREKGFVVSADFEEES